MSNRDVRIQNQRSWDAVVPAHVSHHRDVPGFLRRGGSSLFPEELTLLGDIRGVQLVHLMCNAGLDTLSLANQGAHVTGVDISQNAVAQARKWAVESGITATFVQSDVYDWLTMTEQQFDRVYCSYGAICWLNDLTGWAHGVARVLSPGGRFVLVEFHPTSNMFNRDWLLERDYPQAGRQLTLHGIDDYVADSGGGLTPSGYSEGVSGFVNTEPCHLFQWSVGEVVTALAQAGLVIERLEEYCYSNGERPFNDMVETAGRRMVAPTHIAKFPLLYGIAATKRGD
ncbi:MAG: class I SAM-dependent methyltransferase [Chloroflexota bacterium]